MKNKITKLGKIYNHKFFLPLIILFTYGCLLIDTIKYPGFVGKHFFIDAKIFLAVSTVLIIFSKNKIKSLFNKLNLFILLVSTAGLVLLTFLEAYNYPNYVLSKFHLNLVGLVYVLIFSFAIYVANIIQKEKGISKKGFTKFILFCILVYALVINVGITFQNALTKDVYIGLHLRDTYDQKMLYQWGNYYSYMKFVKDNTPENATIIIPPQTSPWLSSGNLLLDRYFLYPRNLIQFGLTIPDGQPKNAYIMIYKGEWCDSHDCEIWPAQTIKATELIVKKPKSSEVEKIIKDYVYSPNNKEYSFGLLKI